MVRAAEAGGESLGIHDSGMKNTSTNQTGRRGPPAADPARRSARAGPGSGQPVPARRLRILGSAGPESDGGWSKNVEVIGQRVKIQLRIPLPEPPAGGRARRPRPSQTAAPRRHRQAQTVCVPFMVTGGDSYGDDTSPSTRRSHQKSRLNNPEERDFYLRLLPGHQRRTQSVHGHARAMSKREPRPVDTPERAPYRSLLTIRGIRFAGGASAVASSVLLSLLPVETG
jgi:hypothetical protein